MNEIDHYVAELSSYLHVGRRTRRRILAEVRDHLDDAVEQQERDAEGAEGADRRLVARTMVLDDFGAPSAIATQFNAQAGTRAMRQFPVLAFLAGVGVFGGFLVAGTTQPHTATPANANLTTQLAFFVAVLGFEIAVVAGFCAAARALPLWRAPVAAACDRSYVRGCALISTGALCLAAVAWVATMLLAVARFTAPNTATLVVGGALMGCCAGVALMSVWLLSVNLFDDEPNEPERASGVLLLGERLVALVRKHSILSCIVVAGLSAVPAMSHAETTLSGAIPWGVIQAGSVVLGFVVLGPTLGLRLRRPRNLE